MFDLAFVLFSVLPFSRSIAPMFILVSSYTKYSRLILFFLFFFFCLIVARYQVPFCNHCLSKKPRPRACVRACVYACVTSPYPLPTALITHVICPSLRCFAWYIVGLALSPHHTTGTRFCVCIFSFAVHDTLHRKANFDNLPIAWRVQRTKGQKEKKA